MKVWKLGWSSVPGKRVALPSLLAGCLLGCANFSVVDANGRSSAWPSALAKSETGSAEANVPAQVPESPEIAAKPVVNSGRAQRADDKAPKSGEPPVLTTKIRSKPKADAILQPVAKLPEASAAAEEELLPIDLVEEETSETTPPFAMPAPAALPVPAPATVRPSDTMTPPPFPGPVATTEAPTAETLTIPPPPATVHSESVSAVVAKPNETDVSKPDMESIEYLEEETPLEIVSADEFDAQLAEKSGAAPAPPAPVVITDETQHSPTPAPEKVDVVKEADASDAANGSDATETAGKDAIAVASATLPGEGMDEEVVELLETDLDTLMGVPPTAPKSEQPTISERDPATPVATSLFQVAGLRFCRQIMGFGQTEPLPYEELKAGHAVLLYVELANFHAEPQSAGYFSKLHSRIVLESPDGAVLQTLEFDDIEDRCESLRTDFFCHYTFKLPESLPTGSYVLRLKVKDVLGGEMAERTMDFAIGTPQLAKGR